MSGFRFRFIAPTVAVALVASGLISGVVGGAPAGASTFFIGSCRAAMTRVGSSETLVANAPGDPCVPQTQGNADIRIPIPLINAVIDVVGPTTFTDALRPTDNDPDADNRAGAIAHAVQVTVGGMRVFFAVDMQVAVDLQMHNCAADPFGLTQQNVLLVNEQRLSDNEAPSTMTIAPGVRLHVNYRQQTENSMLLRGMWIENLPSHTIDIAVGEASASLYCVISD